MRELNFFKRYIFALFIIGVLSISAYINMVHLIDKQSKYAEIINKSGRQRMLSQQIALFAIYYKIKKLKQITDKMEQSHNFLTNLPNLSKLEKKLLFEKPIYLDKRVKRYIKNAKSFCKHRNGHSLSYILSHSQSLSKDLDKLTNAYQKDSEKKVKELILNERIILFLTLFTLLVEALFIFKPANDKIKEKTEELIKEKSYEETISELSPTAIIAIEENQKIRRYNKHAQKIFGYTKDEMIGKDNLYLIIPDKYIKKHKEAVKRFFETNKMKYSKQHLEVEGKRKNGDVFSIRLSLASAFFKGDQKIVIANITDLSEEKEKDRMLLRQSRTAALGEMIGNIAHQWRQPLSSIKTITSGIKLRKKMGLIDDEELEKGMSKIMEYTDYLSQTISDFRSFFAKEHHKESFRIADVVYRAVSLSDASFKNNHISVEYDFEKDMISARYLGYPNELTQVLLNILNNAKDAMVAQNIKERLVKIYLFKKKSFYEIQICDSGGGVSENLILKIFDPYFTTKHQSQGTGMGLYMSSQIIKEHFNGDLSVSNKEFCAEDKSFYGACFKISLPA